MSGWLSRVDDWLNAPAPAERLAAMRIIVGAFVVVYLLIDLPEVQRLNSVDPADFSPVGLAHLLSDPVPAAVLWAVYVGAIATGIGAVVGWSYRFVAPLFATLVLFWVSYHSSFGQLLHFEHLFTLHVMILAVSPAAAIWSASSRWATNEPEPSVRFGWPIRLLAIATVVTYVLPGLAKLSLAGWAWLDGSVLGGHIAYSITRTELVGGPTPPLGDWVLDHGWLLAPMAIGTLVVELGSPLALLGGRRRDLWVLCALVFHAVAGLIMWVYFGYRGFGFAMAPFYRAELPIRTIAARFATRRPKRPRGLRPSTP